MRLLYYIKTTLNSMYSQALICLASFILLPAFLAGFMGFLENSTGENPLEYNKLKVKIVDEDKSSTSKELIKFLKSSEMKNFIEIGDENKSEIIIPKGYENLLLSQKSGEIVIKDKDNRDVTKVLKAILDNYHQNLLLSLQGESNEELNNLLSKETIENIVIDVDKSTNSYETYAVKLLSLVISMLIYNIILSGYLEPAKNLDKRMLSIPIKRSTYFIYDSIAMIIYSSIIIGGYILFYKAIGITFKGEIIPLLIIILVTSLFITALTKLILSIFSEKYGKVIGFILFTLPIVFGNIFMNGNGRFEKFTPIYYPSKLFNYYTLHRNILGIESILLTLLLIGVVLFIIGFIIEALRKESKI